MCVNVSFLPLCGFPAFACVPRTLRCRLAPIVRLLRALALSAPLPAPSLNSPLASLPGVDIQAEAAAEAAEAARIPRNELSRTTGRVKASDVTDYRSVRIIIESIQLLECPLIPSLLHPFLTIVAVVLQWVQDAEPAGPCGRQHSGRPQPDGSVISPDCS